jgi:hypothetical protein
MLADAIGIDAAARGPLRLVETKAHSYKLVTFVPEKDVQRVADAFVRRGRGPDR